MGQPFVNPTPSSTPTGAFKVLTLSRYLAFTPMKIPATKIEPEVSHHILVVDRSGSMYSDIESLKQSLEQALAVESYGNPAIKTTLISFSSQGDVTLHWNNVAVSEIMQLDKPYVAIIRGIRATCMTGMSQGLMLALKQVNPNETTGITLFTDGYANDPSPSHENKNLDAFVKEASGNPRLFLNCIGYRTWCDWPRLNAMSNALSGKTVQAKSFRDVLDTMRDTQQLLAKGVCPSVALEDGDADFILATINEKVLTNRGTLKLVGIGEGQDVNAWSVKAIKESQGKGIPALARDSRWVYGALAYAQMSLGNLREAKEALFQSGNKTLYEEHKSALTPSALADMMTDLQKWVGARNDESYVMGVNAKPKHQMSDLVEALNDLDSNSVALDLDAFWKTYTRRSVKKLLGKREDDGTITPNNATGEGIGDCYIRSADWSTTEATLNLGTVRKLVIKDKDGNPVDKVGHRPLDLSEFRSYTLLGSGELVVKELPLKILTKGAWNDLKDFLPALKANKEFEPGKTYTLRLKDFSLVQEAPPDIDAISTMMKEMPALWFKDKIFRALAKAPEVHEDLTPGQIEDLAKYHITRSMYFSPPTTVPYTDRQEALSKGIIDTYTRVKVQPGTVGMIGKGQLLSANAALARFCEVSINGEVQAKPDILMYWKPGFKASLKPRSAKAKYGPVDDVMETVIREVLIEGPAITETSLRTLQNSVDKKLDAFEELIRPLVIELGCTGMMPRGLSQMPKQMDADALLAAYPNVKLSKDEKEGTFFVFDNGNLVLTVFSEVADYTPSKTGEADVA